MSGGAKREGTQAAAQGNPPPAGVFFRPRELAAAEPESGGDAPQPVAAFPGDTPQIPLPQITFAAEAQLFLPRAARGTEEISFLPPREIALAAAAIPWGK